jgi:hypothetical protein
MERYLGPQVVERILWWNSVAASMRRDQVPVSSFGRTSRRLSAFKPIPGAVDLILERDLVGNTELVLRAPPRLIRHARLPKVRLGAYGKVARVTGKRLLGIRLEGRTDEAERRSLSRRVAKGGCQIWQ